MPVKFSSKTGMLSAIFSKFFSSCLNKILYLSAKISPNKLYRRYEIILSKSLLDNNIFHLTLCFLLFLLVHNFKIHILFPFPFVVISLYLFQICHLLSLYHNAFLVALMEQDNSKIISFLYHSVLLKPRHF